MAPIAPGDLWRASGVSAGYRILLGFVGCLAPEYHRGQDGEKEIEMSGIAGRRSRSDLQASVQAGTAVVASTGATPFDQIMLDGRHELRATSPPRLAPAMLGPALTSCF
jgi:hypothetical protein